ncbi:unnamed protein product [Cladocopium goreaui]|uniref:Pentacotripeptide-repeat region of PRORP domain-containing protein n=1 Tax=Cladocopium goreaui TaxID=2562237 RepID=A0A9P1DPM6_9DINO|nr:unnamed protein product [Cladocopium goreaui]
MDTMRVMQRQRAEPNLVIYNSALTALGAAWRNALELVTTIATSAQQCDVVTLGAVLRSIEDWPRAFQLLSAQVWSGMDLNLVLLNSLLGRHWRWALGLNSRLVLDQTSYNSCINAAGEALPAAWCYAAVQLSSMASMACERDQISFNSAIKACQGHWNPAMKIFNSMRLKEVCPSVRSYGSSIAAAASSRHWRFALQLWQHPNIKASLISGNAVVSAFTAWTRAMELLQMLRNGLQVSTVTFGAAMAGEIRWHRALQLLREVREVRLEVTIISCNSVMNACAEESKWEMAAQLMSEIRSSRIQATVVTQNTLLLALANGAEWPRALHVASEMVKDETSYNTLIDALARGGQWEASLCILQVMFEESTKPSRISFNSAINACASDGRWSVALALLERMKKADLELNAIGLSSCVTAMGRGRQWALALELLRLRPADQPDTMSCNSAIVACGGQWWRIFELLCCIASPDLITYSSCIGSMARNANWPLAVEILRLMPKSRISPELVCYNSTFAACHRSGQWRYPLALAAQMSLDVIGFNNLIGACAQDAQWHRALGALRLLEAPNSDLPDAISFGGTIHACAKRARWNEALQLLEKLSASMLEAELITYCSCMAACNRAAQFHATLRLSIDVGPIDPMDPVLLGHCFSACVATRHAGTSD